MTSSNLIHDSYISSSIFCLLSLFMSIWVTSLVHTKKKGNIEDDLGKIQGLAIQDTMRSLRTLKAK